MEDSLENQYSPNIPHNPSTHSDINPNTNCATTTNQYLNLNNPSNPFRLDTKDNPTIILVTYLLNSDNYATWSRAMQRALRAKNKLTFITGTINQPTDQLTKKTLFFICLNDVMTWWFHGFRTLSVTLSDLT
jgi:hypothetical protein